MSKDISAFFDRSSNQQSENKACNLSVRLSERLQFTNMLFLKKKSMEFITKLPITLPYLYLFLTTSFTIANCNKSSNSSKK